MSSSRWALKKLRAPDTHPAFKRVVAFDEGRFGLCALAATALVPDGGNVLAGRVQDEYEWLWLYAVVEPTTGTGVFLLLPTMEGHCLEIFLQHLRQHLSNTIFPTLDELQNALIDELQHFWEHPTVLLQFTGYPRWVEVVQ
jgi:hypothetical protein